MRKVTLIKRFAKIVCLREPFKVSSSGELSSSPAEISVNSLTSKQLYQIGDSGMYHTSHALHTICFSMFHYNLLTIKHEIQNKMACQVSL